MFLERRSMRDGHADQDRPKTRPPNTSRYRHLPRMLRIMVPVACTQERRYDCRRCVYASLRGASTTAKQLPEATSLLQLLRRIGWSLAYLCRELTSTSSTARKMVASGQDSGLPPLRWSFRSMSSVGRSSSNHSKLRQRGFLVCAYTPNVHDRR